MDVTWLAIQAGSVLGAPLELSIRVPTGDRSLWFAFLTAKRWILEGSTWVWSAASCPKHIGESYGSGLVI